MNAKGSLWAGALAAVGASLCCVAPLVLVTLGIGGAWIASLASLEPLRPIFVVLTLALLAQAGHKLYRQPVSCEPGRVCAELTCATCPITVKKALSRVEGATRTTVDYEKKLAIVTFDDAKTNVDTLTWATAEAGYPATLMSPQK